MRVVHKKNSKITNVIIQHVKDNSKFYLLVACILLIGITLGVIFVNNFQTEQVEEVGDYINEFIAQAKNGGALNNGEILKNSIKNNLLLVIIMWFAGSTVIGIPIVLGIVWYRGFCLGYTVAVVIAMLGTVKGMIFFITSILLQNLIVIPCILALAVSGIKLYKSIIKDKRRENIKEKIITHTMFSCLMLIFLMIASLLEAYISSNLFIMCAQYI